MKAKRFGAWIIQKIAVSLSLEGPANSRSPRAQSKATAGAFPEGLLTLTTVWAEQRCPETLATLQLFNLCLLSWGWGQPHYSQQGLGASLVHARPGHGHPKQLDQVCTPLGRIPAAYTCALWSELGGHSPSHQTWSPKSTGEFLPDTFPETT